MLEKTSLGRIRSVLYMLYVLKPAKRADFSMIGRFVNSLMLEPLTSIIGGHILPAIWTRVVCGYITLLVTLLIVLACKVSPLDYPARGCGRTTRMVVGKLENPHDMIFPRLVIQKASSACQ